MSDVKYPYTTDVIAALKKAGFGLATHVPIEGSEGLRVWREGFTLTRSNVGLFVEAMGAGTQKTATLERYAAALREAGIECDCRGDSVSIFPLTAASPSP